MTKYEFWLKITVAVGVLCLLSYVVVSGKDSSVAGLLVPVLLGVFAQGNGQPVEAVTNE